jgi:thiamine pyrophosphokinase
VFQTALVDCNQILGIKTNYIPGDESLQGMGKERRTCLIVGAVPMKFSPLGSRDRQNCYIICADGGYDNAARFHICPDLMVGDFDSIMSPLPEGVETIRLQVEKDDTDTMVAVKEGIRRGYREFVLCGVLRGVRCDHSYANLCVLQYLSKQGCKAVIEDGSNRIFLLKAGKLILRGVKGRTVSVFPFGCPSCEVSYIGMKYPLTRAVLSSAVPLGVSNTVEEENAQIMVSSGDALVFLV